MDKLDKRIYFDMDGVLADLIGAICTKIGISVDEWAIGKYEFTEAISKTEDELKHVLTDRLYAKLKPLGDGFGAVGTAEALFGGDNIFILSSPKCGGVAGKIQWLKKFMPEYWQNHHVIFTHAKHILARPQDVLVDDHDKQIEMWQLAGGIGLLVPRRWNSGHRFSGDVGTFLNKKLNEIYDNHARVPGETKGRPCNRSFCKHNYYFQCQKGVITHQPPIRLQFVRQRVCEDYAEGIDTE